MVSDSTSGVPPHIITLDYLGWPYGTTSISWSQAAPYLTWAQVEASYGNAVHAAGIKTIHYVDPNFEESRDPLYTTDENTFAHTCSSSRIYQMYNGQPEYAMAIGTTAMQQLFANFVKGIVTQGHFDAIFNDQAGPLSEFHHLNAFPCSYSDSQWINYGIAINQVSQIPVIFNGLSAFQNHGPSLALGLLNGTNTIGGTLEHCYDNNLTSGYEWVWTATENTELQVGAKAKTFVCLVRNTNSASTQIAARLYALASFLLTYNPSSSVLWEEFTSSPSGLRVMPETGLVPLSPTISAPASVSYLARSGGTYVRQFNACYLRRSLVGRCAVVVNPGYSSAPFPLTTYHHTLVLSGAGVLDGGKVYTNGPAPPAYLGAERAAVVFP